MLPTDALIGQITVEIDGLRSMAATMRRELTQGFRMQATPVQDALLPDASVGSEIAGVAWAGLQDTYSTAIQETLDALYNLNLGTQAMADVADVIAQDYGDADGLARARVRDVQKLMGTTSANPTTGTTVPTTAVGVVTGD